MLSATNPTQMITSRCELAPASAAARLPAEVVSLIFAAESTLRFLSPTTVRHSHHIMTGKEVHHVLERCLNLPRVNQTEDDPGTSARALYSHFKTFRSDYYDSISDKLILAAGSIDPENNARSGCADTPPYFDTHAMETLKLAKVMSINLENMSTLNCLHSLPRDNLKALKIEAGFLFLDHRPVLPYVDQFKKIIPHFHNLHDIEMSQECMGILAGLQQNQSLKNIIVNVNHYSYKNRRGRIANFEQFTSKFSLHCNINTWATVPEDLKGRDNHYAYSSIYFDTREAFIKEFSRAEKTKCDKVTSLCIKFMPTDIRPMESLDLFFEPFEKFDYLEQLSIDDNSSHEFLSFSYRVLQANLDRKWDNHISKLTKRYPSLDLQIGGYTERFRPIALRSIKLSRFKEPTARL